MADPRIRALHRELEKRRPRLLPADEAVARASVALLVRPGSLDLEVLLIERPVSANDPWSGHMALPGGRRNPREDAFETVVREVHEEVGLDLAAHGMLIGRLDEQLPAGGPRIAVSPFVFSIPFDTDLSPEPREVARIVWIPLRHLSDPASAAEHLHILPTGDPLHFPALAYGPHIIWGLTYRMLTQFLGIVRSVTREGDA